MRKELIPVLFGNRRSGTTPIPPVLAIPTNISASVVEPIIADYYVSSSEGDDSNDGLTEQTAWATLSKVETESSNFVAGDVIGLDGGFQESLSLSSVIGTNTSPITFTSYRTNQAVIKGSEEIIGWTDEGGNVWSSDVTGKTIYSTIDYYQAREPEFVSFNNTNNFLYVTSVDSNSVFYCTDLIGHADIVGATVFIRTLPFIREEKTITAFDDTTGKITLDSSTSNGINDGEDFWVQGHINLLKYQDQFFYENDKLYVYSTSDPISVTAITSNNDGLTLTNCAYINVYNLEISGFNSKGVYNNSSDNTLIKNCKIDKTYINGINVLSSDNVLIENNEISNVNNKGINLVNSDSNIVRYNKVRNIYLLTNMITGGTSTGENAIFTSYHSQDANIYENECYNLGFNGIYISNPENITIQKNYIYNFGLNMEDGGGIYGSGNGGTISNNIVKGYPNQQSDWIIYCIYLDDNANGYTTEYNTTEGSLRGIFSHNNQSNIFRYNNIYKPLGAGIAFKNDNIGNDAELNDTNNNNIYIENLSEAPLRIGNSLDNTWDVGVFDYNKYYNTLSSDSVELALTVDKSFNTLSEWQVKSSQDSNSSDNAGITITDSYLAVNTTNVSSDIDLPTGTWQNLDGTEFTTTITLNAYSSEMLIKL